MSKLEEANCYIKQNRIPYNERPAFHITAPIGWINDPNGFSVYKNQYHLFYQYHPYSDVWGPMHWGHCRSNDFIKWEELPVALAPDEPYDAGGCFSGSAIETDEGHALIYTGVCEKEKDGHKQFLQNQCLAIGDGNVYQKTAGNPVIDGSALPNGFSREDFRDPKIWYENGTYYLVAGNRKSDGLGQIVMFSSNDLQNWKYETVLAENKGDYGRMWECPDFFKLDGTQVLIISPQDMRACEYDFYNGNQAVCFLGEYDSQNYKFSHGDGILLDHGFDFYAPQTLLTGDNRRIMIAWMQSWDANIKPAEQKWNGMMTVPRELRVNQGCLYQSPVKELEKYHTNYVSYHDAEVFGECCFDGIKGRVLDLTVEILAGEYNSFSIQFAHNEDYTTGFTYHKAERIIAFDRTYSGMIREAVSLRKMKVKDPQNTLKLRILLDKFSAELFVNDGRQTFSATFYTPPEADGIVFGCDGTAKVNIEKYDIQTEVNEQ